MSTGTDIIEKALQKIKAHSLASPALPGDISGGVTVLNSMLQRWESMGICLGITPIDAPGDKVNEPMDATNAIILNLAIDLAPDYDNGQDVVTPRLVSNARRDFNIIKSIYQVVAIPDKVVSSTLPKGSGNRQRGGYNNTYFAKGETLTETP